MLWILELAGGRVKFASGARNACRVTGRQDALTCVGFGADGVGAMFVHLKAIIDCLDQTG
jgi:hypothetical protein